MFSRIHWLLFYALFTPIIAIALWWLVRDSLLPDETITLEVQSDVATYSWLSWQQPNNEHQQSEILAYFDTPQVQNTSYPITITLNPAASHNTASQGQQVWLLGIWSGASDSGSWDEYQNIASESAWKRVFEGGISQRHAMLFESGTSQPFVYSTRSKGQDVTLSFISHPWSGAVNISINGGNPVFVDLYGTTGEVKVVHIVPPRNMATLTQYRMTIPLHGAQTIRWFLGEVPGHVRIQNISLSGVRNWQWQSGASTPRAGLGVTFDSNDAEGLKITTDNSTTAWLEWSDLPALPNYPISRGEQLFIVSVCLCIWAGLFIGWLAYRLTTVKHQRAWTTQLFGLLPIILIGSVLSGLISRNTRAIELSVSDESTQFQVSSVAEGLESPTGLSFAKDGRMFIIEKGGFSGAATGRVKLLNGNGSLPETILEIPVCSDAERGLVGMVLDPKFETNSYIYLYYTRQLDNCAVPSKGTPPVTNRVARFTFNGTKIDPASEVILVDGIPAMSGGHNAGGMRFMSDGTLLIATGEGIPGPTAQNLEMLGGKILRIHTDPDNLVPNDNPFATSTNANTRLVWAYGLRNPYRFDINSKDMVVIADVGSAPPKAREEINIGKAGANYGWPNVEGVVSDSKYTSPVYSYEHDKSCNSIIGGAFVDDAYGPNYANNYIFGDFSCGSIWALALDDKAVTHIAHISSNAAHHPVHFERGIDGYIYFADISGKIWRIESKKS